MWKTRQIKWMGLTAGVISLLALALYVSPKNTGRDPALLSFQLPQDLSIEGEAVSNLSVSSLSFETVHDTQRARLDEKASRLDIRLAGPHDFFDITLGRTLNLTGFSSFTPVTLSSAAQTILDRAPMDWNGRIILDMPADRALYPVTIHIAQPAIDITLSSPIGGRG